MGYAAGRGVSAGVGGGAWASKASGHAGRLLSLRLEHAQAPRRGRRMTGSAFPIAYRARDVVYRLAPQDTYNYRKLREQKGVPERIPAEAGG